MNIAALLLLSIPVAAIAVQLGALALAGYWALRDLFSPQGLLAPARGRRY
jgi:hypothetical protein